MMIQLPQVKNPSGLQATPIEWADYSFNPLRAIDTKTGKVGWACTKVGDDCTNCYAESINKRFGTGQPFTAQGTSKVEFVLDEQRIRKVLSMRKPRNFVGKAGDGRPKVFIGDMTDIFHPRVGFETLDIIWAMFALTPWIDWMILTKRPGQASEYLADDFLYQRIHEAVKQMLGYDNPDRPAINRADLPLSNLWLGTSVGNRKGLPRMDQLRDCRAAIRFVSFEPLIERVDPPDMRGIDWAIIGGESGNRGVARPCDIDWIDNIRQRCSGCAAFVKQLGTNPFCARERWSTRGGGVAVDVHALRHWTFRDRPKDSKGGDPAEWPEHLRVRQWPEAAA